MKAAAQLLTDGRRSAPGPRWLAVLALACLAGAAGCLSWHGAPPRPGATRFGAATVIVPARLVGNVLIVEAKWDKFGPYHFLIDTGATETVVSPELAQRYAATELPQPAAANVPVRSSTGEVTVLPATILSRLELGKVRFEAVPALIYDCSTLTSQYGVKIDGLLAFPLFREARLTLDYARARVILHRNDESASPPGETIAFDNEDKRPLIPVRLGERTFDVLIDSGSDEAFSLNPAGINPKFAFGPVDGPLVSTLTGDRAEQIGRLADTLYLGRYAVPRPVVDLTDDLAAIGGGILKYFVVTFDQTRDEVTFFRDAPDPVAIPSRRGVGLSFNRTPAYWRVAAVVPASPADNAGVAPGDLVTKINGEPVSEWTAPRYERMVANGESALLTFLNGTREADKRLRVVEIVP